MTVSFDFDGTLSRPDVQEYARELIKHGIDVIVTTSRYDESNKHLYPVNPTNEDLYAVTDKLGIPREKINFMNMGLKADFLKDTDVIWHLDDDDVEIRAIDYLDNPIRGVPALHEDWREICAVIMEKRINEKLLR